MLAVVPYEAATPELVIVGFLMMRQVAGIQWKNYEIAIPAFVVYFTLGPIKTLLGV